MKKELKRSFTKEGFTKLLETAFQEDFIDLGDVTGSAIFSDETDDFVLVSKDQGILCGIKEFCQVMKSIDLDIIIKSFFTDGDTLVKGDVIATISGKVAAVLKAERTALNLLSHLSGIASKTNLFVLAVAGKTTILDTRKTLPGLREWQKYAVRCGGGSNHRMGLYDMVMIKDNHIDAAGGIDKAVEKIRTKWGDRFQVEVETRNLSEVQQALDCGVERIMLDNMDNDTMNKAVKLVAGICETEASGNMTLERIPDVAQTGIDFISVGELTHTVKAFDFSLKKK